MDIADRYGEDLRRLLESADFLSDLAILPGSFQVNTPSSSTSALLFSVTRCDHFFVFSGI